MFAINQDEADKSSVRVTRHLGNGFSMQLVFASDRFDPWRLLGWLRGEATILTDNILLFVDNATAVGRNCGRALLNAIACRLSLLLLKVRNPGHPWWELGDYLLADIGKTPGEAEVEKRRRRPAIRDLPEDLGI